MTKNETRTKRKQSMTQALRCEWIRRALNGLAGCPVGGWAETEQARRRLTEDLPFRNERSYSTSDLITYALGEDAAGRYEWRAGR